MPLDWSSRCGSDSMLLSMRHYAKYAENAFDLDREETTLADRLALPAAQTLLLAVLGWGLMAPTIAYLAFRDPVDVCRVSSERWSNFYHDATALATSTLEDPNLKFEKFDDALIKLRHRFRELKKNHPSRKYHVFYGENLDCTFKEQDKQAWDARLSDFARTNSS